MDDMPYFSDAIAIDSELDPELLSGVRKDGAWLTNDLMWPCTGMQTSAKLSMQCLRLNSPQCVPARPALVGSP